MKEIIYNPATSIVVVALLGAIFLCQKEYGDNPIGKIDAVAIDRNTNSLQPDKTPAAAPTANAAQEFNIVEQYQLKKTLVDNLRVKLAETLSDVDSDKIANIIDERYQTLQKEFPGSEISEELLAIEVKDAIKIEQAKEKGYFDSIEMDQYPLETVESLAESGDIKAMQNLADRYYFSLKKRSDSPEAAKEYSDKAISLYRETVSMGSIRSASILSEIALIEKKPEQAYAWHLIAKKLGDKRQQLYEEHFANTLTEEQIKAGQSLYQAESANIYNRAIELNQETAALEALTSS